MLFLENDVKGICNFLSECKDHITKEQIISLLKFCLTYEENFLHIGIKDYITHHYLCIEYKGSIIEISPNGSILGKFKNLYDAIEASQKLNFKIE